MLACCREPVSQNGRSVRPTRSLASDRSGALYWGVERTESGSRRAETPAHEAYGVEHDVTVHVRIEARDLPGRECGSGDASLRCENVHVGLQRRREPFALVPGDAPSATWEFELTTRPGADGGIDVGGPFAQGRPGDRFVYLTWGTLDTDGTFTMFRRAKLHLADIDAQILGRAAGGEGPLVARLGITDECGLPICARIRPPRVIWSCG
jgi:Family of unknown function (DUF5990)